MRRFRWGLANRPAGLTRGRVQPLLEKAASVFVGISLDFVGNRSSSTTAALNAHVIIQLQIFGIGLPVNLNLIAGQLGKWPANTETNRRAKLTCEPKGTLREIRIVVPPVWNAYKSRERLALVRLIKPASSTNELPKLGVGGRFRI